MYIGICTCYFQDFAADFDIVQSRRPNGIKLILFFVQSFTQINVAAAKLELTLCLEQIEMIEM